MKMMAEFRTATQEATMRAKAAGIPADAVLPFVEEEIRTRPVRLDYRQDMVNPAFMRVEIITSERYPGLSQFRLNVNIGHPWISLAAFGPEVTPAQRDMVEIMLLCIASPDRRTREERMVLDREIESWSSRLYHGGNILESIFFPDGRPEESDDDEDEVVNG